MSKSYRLDVKAEGVTIDDLRNVIVGECGWEEDSELLLKVVFY